MSNRVSVLGSLPARPSRLANPTGCSLVWRQRKLAVRSVPLEKQISFPPLETPEGLVNCLQRSPVRLVRLDLPLGESQLRSWANACHGAKKPAYVRVLPTRNLPSVTNPLQWKIKRSFDWLAAALILLLSSPMMIAIALLLSVSSPGPILFRQWRVGERGKLFQILKFRTMVVDAERQHHQVMGNQAGLHKLKDDPRITPIGRLLRRYSLDELPQLLNVLRGEMSLVGPRPWALYDAVRIAPELQHRLNALPGITGAWQVEARSTQLDINIVNRNDLNYLSHWSLVQDFKFLLMTIPKVISGFGAY